MLTRATACGTVVLLLCCPIRAEAQFLAPLESLFRKIDGVTIFGMVGDMTGAERLEMEDFLGFNAVRGVGVEVLIELTEMNVDSSKWGWELAFGADFLTGFKAADPDIDLRGSIRGLPTLSAYATPPFQWGSINLYLGVNVGFVQLWNVEVYNLDGEQFGLKGDTFQIGLALGLYHRSGFFLEGSYRNRDFRSIKWELPNGSSELPDGWPRSANLSALILSLGFQFGALAGD
jgi:hypothetical protein